MLGQYSVVMCEDIRNRLEDKERNSFEDKVVVVVFEWVVRNKGTDCRNC